MLRTFYRAVPAGERVDEFRGVVDYEMGEFDLTRLWFGQPFSGELPSCVRLFLSDGPDADYLHAPMSWHLYSERAAGVLTARAGSDIQLLRAPLFAKKDGRRIPGFRILNAIRCVAGLDLDQSDVRRDDDDPGRIVSVGRFVFRRGRIPAEMDIFRPAEFGRATLFSERMVHDFDGLGMRNVGFLEVGCESS